MAERTQYPPGTFSWTDLSTSDQDGAKAFYTELFGWDVQDNPVDENTVYSMMLLDGKPVAAISPQPPNSGRRASRRCGTRTSRSRMPMQRRRERKSSAPPFTPRRSM